MRCFALLTVLSLASGLAQPAVAIEATPFDQAESIAPEPERTGLFSLAALRRMTTFGRQQGNAPAPVVAQEGMVIYEGDSFGSPDPEVVGYQGAWDAGVYPYGNPGPGGGCFGCFRRCCERIKACCARLCRRREPTCGFQPELTCGFQSEPTCAVVTGPPIAAEPTCREFAPAGVYYYHEPTCAEPRRRGLFGCLRRCCRFLCGGSYDGYETFGMGGGMPYQSFDLPSDGTYELAPPDIDLPPDPIPYPAT